MLTVASQQAVPTKRVLQAAERLLEYAAQYPSHRLGYHACDTVLHIQSDASFLSRSECRSVAGGVHYLGNKDEPLQVNGPLLALSRIISCVTLHRQRPEQSMVHAS